MKRIIEVELKFQVLDTSEIEKFLKSLKFISKKRIVDIYLDTKGENLFKQGIFIRIRNQENLDFKFNPKHFQKHNSYCAHNHCDELSFSLPLSAKSLQSINEVCRVLRLNKISSSNLVELKRKNKLIESMTIDKLRQEYNDEKFTYAYDKVKSLGRFIEIEYSASPKDDIERIKREMNKRLKGLAIKHMNVGYNEIYWRRHNFDLYLQGIYLLDEDYKKYRSESS